MSQKQFVLLATRVKYVLGSNYDYIDVKRTIVELYQCKFDEEYQGLSTPDVVTQVRNYWGIDLELNVLEQVNL